MTFILGLNFQPEQYIVDKKEVFSTQSNVEVIVSYCHGAKYIKNKNEIVLEVFRTFSSSPFFPSFLASFLSGSSDLCSDRSNSYCCQGVTDTLLRE